MRALLLVALVLLPAALPPVEAQSGYRIDGTLVVQSTALADLQYHVVGISNRVLQLFTPDGATLTEARDLDGKRLDARTEGDFTYVDIGRRGATIHYALKPEHGPPFVVFPVQLNGGEQPSTLSLQLPAGWGLAGAVDRTAGGSPTFPDANGRFQRAGGGYFYYAVTPPEVADPGPDRRVKGGDVLREANATVTATSVRVRIDHVYDTGHYGAQWKSSVPADATDVHVSTPHGTLPYQRVGNELSFTTPYPHAFDLGGRNFTVAYSLPAPERKAGPFREVEINVPSGRNDTVTTRVVLPPDARFTGALLGGAVEVAPLTWRALGPSVVTLRYLPAAEPGRVRMTEGVFVVDAPESLAVKARVIARNASELLPRAAGFLEAPAPARPFFVAYTDEAVFGWEEGFYANGFNTITIRGDSLRNVTTEPEVDAVSTLLHETVHGLFDRQMPDVGENNSFLREGLSRLSEVKTELAFPGKVPRCNGDGTSCHPGARLTAASLHKFHKENKTLDIAWAANKTAGDDRGFLYSYSGTVIRAFEQRAPPGALQAVLLNLSRAPVAPTDAQEAERIVATFLAHAPGTTRQAFLYPGRELGQSDLEHFRACMGDLVAPPYPWERDGLGTTKTCPANGYGGSTATLPPPPPESERERPPPEPVPVTPATPSPRPLIPTPTYTPPTEEPPIRTTTPGAVVTPEPPGGTVEVPGPSLGIIVALAALVALALRRR